MLEFRTRLSLVVAQISMYKKYKEHTILSPFYCPEANYSRLYYFTSFFCILHMCTSFKYLKEIFNKIIQ